MQPEIVGESVESQQLYDGEDFLLSLQVWQQWISHYNTFNSFYHHIDHTFK